MTRLLRSAVAAALLALGLSLFLPTLAVAADAAPWVGTYKGVAVGKDTKGKKARSGVTVWVEDLGGSTKFTFRFDKLPVVIDQTAPNAGGQNGSMLVRFSMNKAGMNGTGMIVLYPKNGNYMIAGKAAGKAAGKQGTGRMSAVRTCTGVDLPSTTQQIKDLFSTLLGKKISSSPGNSGGSEGGGPVTAPAARLADLRSDDAGTLYAVSAGGESAVSQDEADAVIKEAPNVVFVKAVTVEPASVIDLAAAKPPATTQTAVTTMVLVLVLTGVAAVVGVGPKVRRPAASSINPGEPSSDGEGS